MKLNCFGGGVARGFNISMAGSRKEVSTQLYCMKDFL